MTLLMQSGSFLKTSAALLAAWPAPRACTLLCTYSFALDRKNPAPPGTSWIQDGKSPGCLPPALLVRLPCLPQPCWSVYLPSLTRVLFGMIEFHQVRTKQTLNNKSQYLGEFSRKWSFLIEVRSLMEHFKGRNLGNVQKFSPLG